MKVLEKIAIDAALFVIIGSLAFVATVAIIENPSQGTICLWVGGVTLAAVLLVYTTGRLRE